MSRLYLRAVPQPGEILRSGLDKRSDLHLQGPQARVAFGRNSSTGIAEATVARRECVFTVQADGSLAIDNIKAAVWVNGMPLAPGMKEILKAGDRICLPDGLYAYEVTLEMAEEDDDDQTATDTTTQQLSPSRKRNASQASLAQTAEPVSAASLSSTVIPASAMEEFYCAVCLEIQVQSTTLVPCGHTFCQSCQSACSECPNCRAAIHARVPCRTINNVISSLALESSQFLADDVNVYKERSGGSSSKVQQPVRPPPRRRGRRNRRQQQQQTNHAPSSGGIISGTSPADAICIE